MSGRKKTKKKVLKDAKVLLACCAIILIGLVFFGGVLLVRALNSGFKIENRVDQVNENKKNDDDEVKTVGWLRVQGTNIDYPVIYAPDVNLSTIVDDFAWTETNYSELNNITFISGHNIKNLSETPYIADESHNRFEQLMSFVYYDFAKENQYFQYTIGEKNYMFKIYSIMFTQSGNLDLYNEKSYTKQQMKNYIKLTKENSIYDFKVDVNYNDKIVSLVTCSRMMGGKSFVVTGRLLRNNEKTKIDNVSRTRNYEDIDNALKGGSLNENA